MSTLFKTYTCTFINRGFTNIYLDVIKVVCFKVSVCGKGLGWKQEGNVAQYHLKDPSSSADIRQEVLTREN